MSKQELLAKLLALQDGQNPESDHEVADELLLKYIADPAITAAFEGIYRWYA
jgi:hypothetical protein